jgi:hypothetical protein
MCFGLLGVVYRLGQARGVLPAQIMFFGALAGAL